MELNGGGYACSREFSTAKSDFFSGKESDLGCSTLEVRALLAVCAVCIRTHICLRAVCVCGDTSRQRNREHSLGNTSFPWVLSEIKQAGDRENKKQKGLGMGFPRIFLFSLNFCIILALVAVAISRGRFPSSPGLCWPGHGR